MKITFIKSAHYLEDCPVDRTPELGIVGRSNAGKSSLINAIAGSLIAKISSKPGKTRLLNFFQVGEHYRLVDMPGYGFAAVSANEIKSWQKMIEAFILSRENLKGLILVMDIRRTWTEDEQLLVDLMNEKGMPLAVLLNKSDKVKQGEKITKRRLVKAIPGVDQVFVTSTTKNQGIKEAERGVFDAWIKPLI